MAAAIERRPTSTSTIVSRRPSTFSGETTTSQWTRSIPMSPSMGIGRIPKMQLFNPEKPTDIRPTKISNFTRPEYKAKSLPPISPKPSVESRVIFNKTKPQISPLPNRGTIFDSTTVNRKDLNRARILYQKQKSPNVAAESNIQPKPPTVKFRSLEIVKRQKHSEHKYSEWQQKNIHRVEHHINPKHPKRRQEIIRSGSLENKFIGQVKTKALPITNEQAMKLATLKANQANLKLAGETYRLLAKAMPASTAAKIIDNAVGLKTWPKTEAKPAMQEEPKKHVQKKLELMKGKKEMKTQQIHEKTRKIFLERQEKLRHVEHTSATWNRIRSTQKIIARLFKTQKQISGGQISTAMANRTVPRREKSTVIGHHEPDGTYTQNVQDISGLTTFSRAHDANTAVTSQIRYNPPVRKAATGLPVSERTIALAYSRWGLAA